MIIMTSKQKPWHSVQLLRCAFNAAIYKNAINDLIHQRLVLIPAPDEHRNRLQSQSAGVFPPRTDTKKRIKIRDYRRKIHFLLLVIISSSPESEREKDLSINPIWAEGPGSSTRKNWWRCVHGFWALCYISNCQNLSFSSHLRGHVPFFFFFFFPSMSLPQFIPSCHHHCHCWMADVWEGINLTSWLQLKSPDGIPMRHSDVNRRL